MKKIFIPLFICIATFKFSFSQIVCVQCFQQLDSISSGVTNLLQNGSFENTTCAPDAWRTVTFCPNSAYFGCSIANWTCIGGGYSTYADVCDSIFTKIPDGLRAVYMGNFYCNGCATSPADTGCLSSLNCDTLCLVHNGCTITGLPFGHPVNVATYGGANGLSLFQVVNGLTVGGYYVLEFWVGGENFQNPGIFGVNVGFGYTILTCQHTDPFSGTNGTRYIIEFQAASATDTVMFTNWGHICSSCSEPIFDDARLYPLSQLSNTVTPCVAVLSATTSQVNSICNQCSGSATANAVSGTAPFSYLWSNNKTSQTVDSLCAGTYTVTITDSTSLTATASVSISDSSSVGSLNITANKNIMCNGDSAVICADPGYVSYLWNDGDTARCITTMLPDNYAVTATGTGGCPDTSTSVTISIYPATPIGITVLGDTLTVNTSSNVQWYKNDTAINGATSSIYITTSAGSYSVQAVDSNGCVVASNPVIISGINKLTSDKVEVYPNPNATGVWQLEVGATLVGNTVEIFNDEGKLIYQSKINNQKSEINLATSGGIYLMQIKAAGNIIFRKLVKL